MQAQPNLIQPNRLFRYKYSLLWKPLISSDYQLNVIQYPLAVQNAYFCKYQPPFCLFEETKVPRQYLSPAIRSNLPFTIVFSIQILWWEVCCLVLSSISNPFSVKILKHSGLTTSIFEIGLMRYFLINIFFGYPSCLLWINLSME